MSNHDGMKIEINYKNKIGKKHKYVEAKQYATKQAMGQQRNSKRKILNTWKQMKMETQHSKICGM